MLELTTVGIVFAAAHLAAVYIGTDIVRLEYTHLMILNVGFAIASSLLTRVTMPLWKSQVISALHRETRDGSAIWDVGGMILAFIVGGILSAVLMLRRYGPVGWLGIIASSAIVNWLI